MACERVGLQSSSCLAMHRLHAQTPIRRHAQTPLGRSGAFHKTADDLRVKRMLDYLDSGVERFRCVAWQNRNFSLGNDCTVIDLFIHKMDGAAGDFLTRSQRLCPCR